MTNILDRLKHDHDAVAVALAGYDKDPVGCANEVKHMLETHTKIEEKILYPAAKSFDKEGVGHAKEEHDKIDELLAKLVDDPRDMAVHHELKEAIEHHVDEEERTGGLFDKVREHVDDATLLEMSEKASKY